MNIEDFTPSKLLADANSFPHALLTLVFEKQEDANQFVMEELKWKIKCSGYWQPVILLMNKKKKLK